MTYAELNAAAARVAGGLVSTRHRPGRSRRVLAARTYRGSRIAYFGILKAGAVVVPLNVLLKSREIAYHLKDSHAASRACVRGND